MTDILELARNAGARIDEDFGMTIVAMFDEQLSAFRDAALEEAAEACNDWARKADRVADPAAAEVADSCAAAIRAMKGTP